MHGDRHGDILIEERYRPARYASRTRCAPPLVSASAATTKPRLPPAQHLALCFNASSGLLASITQKRLGITLPASQAIGYYRASTASNHYVFTPLENTAQMLPVTKLLVTSQSVSSLFYFETIFFPLSILYAYERVLNSTFYALIGPSG